MIIFVNYIEYNFKCLYVVFFFYQIVYMQYNQWIRMEKYNSKNMMYFDEIMK